MAVHTALYPGTFDCLTYGHLDLIERCAKLFDHVVVAIAMNTAKIPLFSIEERLDMIREAVTEWPNVRVDTFECLTVKYARDHNITCMIRGLRAISDFESELQLALMNQQAAPEVETIFMTPSLEYVFVSSSLTKEILALHGDVSKLVPPHVEQALLKKLR